MMADDEGSRYSTSTKCNNLIVRKCNSVNSVNDIGKNTETSNLQPHFDTTAGLNSGSYQYHQPRLSLEDLRERSTYHDDRFTSNRLSVDICYRRNASSIRRPTKTRGDIPSNVPQARRSSEQNYLEIVASGPLSLGGATGRESEYLQVIQGGDERPLQDHFVPIYREAEDIIVAATSSVASQSAERLSRVTDESVYADIPTESLYLETPPRSTSWRRQ